ncbi:MAG: fibronectin type III domain-containing protein [Cyclobacteriaceae bacterium]|nr:fibronectin type III domain-containing protein [Cyclobacteriaceae bacterium]
MKSLAKIAIFIAVFTSLCNLSYSQIDTTWTYFHYRNNGPNLPGTWGAGPLPSGNGVTIDIRLVNNENNFPNDYTTRFYLTENKTFSFRKNNSGLFTDSYHAMAGFNSINYTQGQLRMEIGENAWLGDRFRMNYRLLFPRNYAANPTVEGGYPMIVMVHGFGERGNCWGGNCYWANGVWNPNDNSPAAITYGISAAESAGSGLTMFTTIGNHQLLTGQQVVIRNSTVSAYNGTRTITAVTSNTFTVGVSFSATATANVSRPGVFELLNNDHSMTHGGAVHQTAVLTTTPAGMVPNNPNMPARAFPGFVLFPQNLNGWTIGAEDVVRIIRLLVKKYNINPNKIYIHGLSDGGAAVYRVIRCAPWLFAGALPMSAVNGAEINEWNLEPFIETIPLWIFQGGTDGNPTPALTQARVQDFRNNGLSVRYTLYPTLGHGVWNNAYAEPDFFSWMRNKDKANIHVKFGNRSICSTTGAPAELRLAQGFWAYQWEKDGELIPGATSHSFSAQFPGTYRARFSRKMNPGPNDWNRWSDPVVITESAPDKPSIQALGSTIFPTINTTPPPGERTVVLQSSEKNTKYYWYKNDVLVNNALTYNGDFTFVQDTLSMILRNVDALDAGTYTLRTADFSGCPSLYSNPSYVLFNSNPTLTEPANFNGTAQSASSIFLSWSDNNSLNETGYEIWRRKAGETTFIMVAVAPEDAVAYLDTNLAPGTTYHYKIRAIGNTTATARSNYVPSNDVNINLEVTTPGDGIAPTPPQNLRVTLNTLTSISLAWDAGIDNTAINRYRVNYGGSSVFTPSNATSFTITGLTANNAYPITVQAEDLSGNLSPPGNLVIGTTIVEGLYYEHSTGAWTTLDPAQSASRGEVPPIDWVTAEFTGKINNFNVNPINVEPPTTPGIATQQDFYKIKFDGYLLLPTFTPATISNHWQFRLTSDDGSMLYIGGFNPSSMASNRILNNDGIKEDGPVSVATLLGTNVSLAPSPSYHRIVVLFNEFTQDQTLTVEYRRKISSGQTDANFTAWAPIPEEWLRSGNFTPPASLAAPTSLAALSNGMTSINLSWIYGGSPAHEFEVYRSLAVDGTFEVVGRATGLAFSDNTVLPGTPYFYKLKTVNIADGATSPFSSTATATTDVDNIIPSVPSGLTLIGKTFSNVVFNWTASTDNVGVAGYEILVNNIIFDTTAVTSYVATGLEPGTLYNFTVKAFDASGNKSAASSVLAVTTNVGQLYYSKSTGALNLTGTWGTNENGTGTAPASFANNGQFYMINNRPTTGLGGPLTIGGSVSKIIVPAGTTLNVDNTISAKIEVQGDGIVNLNNATTAPEFLSLSPASTVNFNAYNIIPAATYGNINLTGSGNKNFEAGDITIMGYLTATSGIALKGAPSNASRVTVHENITLAGTPAVVATDNALDLTLAKVGTQTLSVNGTLDLYRISTAAGTTASVVNGGSAVTLNIGSPNGGGLMLANGSTLNLGNNHLVMKNAATINAGGLTGRLALNGSNLTLNSSSAQNSNLYLDNVLNTAGMVTTTFSNNGDLMIHSPLRITDGLKIEAGEVNSAGNITLVSTQTKTAYLQEIESNGSITGAAKVERWVSVARKYRYMSSAVANMTVANWQVHMPITGPFTGSSPNSPNPSMFYYVENNGGYINYPHNGSNNSVTFERGRGYSIFNYNGNNPLTLTMTGQPYQGSVSYTSILTPGTGSTSNGGDGWNLVGNPYASAIQWNNLTSDWTKSGLSAAVYVPDNTTGTLRFYTYDADTGLGLGGNYEELTGGIIAPGQAFWVKTTDASPTLTIHEKAKRTNTSTFYRERSSSVNHLIVKLSNGELEDNAFVILGNNYEDTYEPELDGVKRKNEKLNLSTRSSENIDLVFNKLSDSFCEKVVPLTIENVVPGNYTLSFENIENLVGVGAVTLTDHFTNTTQILTGGDHYNFAVTSNAASIGANRFTLTLGRPALQKNALATMADVCGGTTATIQLTNTQESSYYYASLPGVESALSNEVMGNGGTITLEVPVNVLQNGLNTTVIRTGFKGCNYELLSNTPLEFTYTPAPQVTIDKSFYSLCQNSQVTLNAETNPENSLRWYKNGQLIANQTHASLVSGPIANTTYFEVAAVINGCEGKKAATYVEINQVPMPLVEFNGDALEVVNTIPADVFLQWYKDNEPLDAYDRGFKPIAEGLYTVLVSKGGCSMISEPFEYLITSSENPVRDGFSAYVYPNPATFDQLYVKLETASRLDAEISLIDLTGRAVHKVSLNRDEVNGTHKLNVSQDTAPGLYIVLIRQGSAVVQRKLILHFE